MLVRCLIAFPLTTAMATAATHEVRASNGFGFVPNVVTIEPGDTVRWINVEGRHNVKADSGLFGNALGPAGWVYEVTFDEVGDFRYYCDLHGGPGGQGMAGQVVVQAATPPVQPAFVINEGVGGAWYNPATSGQGLLLEASPAVGVLTLAWFTWSREGGDYDWLTGAGAFDGNMAVVDLVRSSGGRFDDPAPVQNAVVGSAILTFSSCGEAVFAYTLQDPPASGEIPLQRILPPLPACLEANAPEVAAGPE